MTAAVRFLRGVVGNGPESMVDVDYVQMIATTYYGRLCSGPLEHRTLSHISQNILNPSVTRVNSTSVPIIVADVRRRPLIL
jgi:hypothetical protein